MSTQEDFQAFYQTHLEPKLIAFEKQRKNIVGKLTFILFIYGILMIFAILAMITLFMITNENCPSWLSTSTLVLTIIGMIVLTLEVIRFYGRIKAPYKRPFKEEIIRPIVTFVDENLNYEPEKKIPVKEFQTSQLFKREYGHKVDRWTGDDYVEGTLDNTTMIFSEVHAQEEKTDKEGSYYDTVFKGLFFIFNYDLKFKGVTLVLPNEQSFFSKFVEKLFFWRKTEGRELVKLGDPEIDREFLVYSDNPTMARHVLSTNFMHRLLAFRRQLKKQIYLSFVNGKLYLAIYVKEDLFEAPVLGTVLNYELLQEIFEYLQLGKEIAEDLIIYLGEANRSL
ncbi:MAG TPA: DUF3137 domain-containing protein [Thioploca sp.]|nr:DUF3137 domain-containing protein [Thioploca sp.]